MKIGVPGEFHEDRWQRTAEDSERRVLPRTREEGRAIRIQVIACQSVLLDGLWHGYPAHRCSRGIPSWQRGTSDRSSARRPCPQVPQGHPRVAKHHLTDLRMVPSRCTSRSSARRVGPQVLQGHPGVAKGASGRSLARRPCPQVPQGHPRVAKHHLTDLRMVHFRCTSRSSARRPCPQVLQRHPGVAKGASGRSSTWDPCPQVPQGHPRVAKGASGRSLARPPRP